MSSSDRFFVSAPRQISDPSFTNTSLYSIEFNKLTWKEEIYHPNINRRRTQQNQKEPPTNLLQSNRPRHNNNNLRRKLIRHPPSRSLTPHVRRENLRHIQILRRIKTATPEDNKQENEENRSTLASDVRSAGVEGLEDCFEEEGNCEANGAYEHEFSAAPAVDVERCENVTRERGSYPEGEEEEGHVARETEVGEDYYGVVGYDEDAWRELLDGVVRDEIEGLSVPVNMLNHIIAAQIKALFLLDAVLKSSN